MVSIGQNGTIAVISVLGVYTFEDAHDDVIKWKHFPRYWPFVREIHRLPVNPPHKGQWRGALMFSLIYAWINGLANNHEAGDLRRHHAHYDVTVMIRAKSDPSHLEGFPLFRPLCHSRFANACYITYLHATYVQVGPDEQIYKRYEYIFSWKAFENVVCKWRLFCSSHNV